MAGAAIAPRRRSSPAPWEPRPDWVREKNHQAETGDSEARGEVLRLIEAVDVAARDENAVVGAQ